MALVWHFPREQQARTLHQIGKTFRCGCVIYNANLAGALGELSAAPLWTFSLCQEHQALGAEFPFRVLIWDGELDQAETLREWP